MTMAAAPKYGIAVELDGNGNILRSIQDPEGKTFDSVSELQEDKDYLYVGSYNKGYLGRIPIKNLPNIVRPMDEATDGTTKPTQPTNADINRQLQAFLAQIKER